MRTFVFQTIFLIVATGVFSQNPRVAASTSEISQNGDQQILQIEAEMLRSEMNSDPATVEKIYADDCINPTRPDWTKAELLKFVQEYQGQAPPYIASEENMRVYMLGDTAIAMFVKKYVVRDNPDQVDRQDITDVFVRSGGTWKLKLGWSRPHQKTES
jgi:hypothetical protein